MLVPMFTVELNAAVPTVPTFTVLVSSCDPTVTILLVVSTFTRAFSCSILNLESVGRISYILKCYSPLPFNVNTLVDCSRNS